MRDCSIGQRGLWLALASALVTTVFVMALAPFAGAAWADELISAIRPSDDPVLISSDTASFKDSMSTLNSVDPVQSFAVRLYTEILGREADPEGLAVQSNALRNGWSPAEIAYNYFNSAEYFLKHEGAGETVERVYHVMFGRSSDEGGKAMWTSMMEDGMSVRAVVQGFSQAEEYRIYFGSIGLSADVIPLWDANADKAWDADGELVYSGPNNRDLNQGAAAFAKRMYTVVLGRTDAVGVDGGIDVAGLNAQAGAIANGMPCWKIALNFFGSQEFEDKGLSNFEGVAIAYDAVLGRTGSDDEVQWWVDEKERSCYSVTDVVLHFCNSNEFNDKVCEPYGLSSGMRGATAATLPVAREHDWSGPVCPLCGAPNPNSEGGSGTEPGDGPGAGDDVVCTVSVGDHVTFGSYEQDNNLGNGTEPIEWRVLAVEDGKALLVSEFGLDVCNYNTSYRGVWWDGCTLRSRMNDFLNVAFSAEEQQRIALSSLENLANPVSGYGDSFVKPTEDRVFVLSLEEVDSYFVSDDDRKCFATPYAVGRNAYSDTMDGSERYCSWWTRSLGQESKTVSYVTFDGVVNNAGTDVDDFLFARPAIWVSADEEFTQVGCDTTGHVWSDYVSDENVTCTEDGTETRICFRCGEVETISDPDSALGHDFVDGVCTRCGEVNEVVENPFANVSVGDRVTFGSYEQDNNLGNGTEPIEWRVLAVEDGRALLISRYALDCLSYNSTPADLTWESCSLRSWLNSAFLSAAFSSAEQATIATVTLTNSDNPDFGTAGGNSTQDKVFCLSLTEAGRYFASDEDRMCAPTPYAIANGAFQAVSPYTVDGVGACAWWLRSPGKQANWAALTSVRGTLGTVGGNVDYSESTVRPAIWVNTGEM